MDMFNENISCNVEIIPGYIKYYFITIVEIRNA